MWKEIFFLFKKKKKITLLIENYTIKKVQKEPFQIHIKSLII